MRSIIGSAACGNHHICICQGNRPGKLGVFDKRDICLKRHRRNSGQPAQYTLHHNNHHAHSNSCRSGSSRVPERICKAGKARIYNRVCHRDTCGNTVNHFWSLRNDVLRTDDRLWLQHPDRFTDTDTHGAASHHQKHTGGIENCTGQLQTRSSRTWSRKMAHHPYHPVAICHAGNHYRCYPCNRPNSR